MPSVSATADDHDHDHDNAASGAQKNAAPVPVPSKWRQALFTLVGVYPIITGLLYLVLPLTRGWQIWQVTLLVAPLMVLMMVFGLVPFIQRRFGRYIMVPPKS